MLEIAFNTKLIISLLIPFLGTLLGSFMVFILKKQLNEKLLKLLIGFSSGVMIAASIWSLLEPSVSSFSSGDFRKWLIPVLGFLTGLLFLFIIDILVPHMHLNKKVEGIDKHNISQSLKLCLAQLIHNIPEGLAVGVVIASAMNSKINQNAALTLCIGIAVQNIPESIADSMSLCELGISKTKSFFASLMSGLTEILIAVIALFICANATVIIPFTLSLIAGTMIYVVADELIPETSAEKKSFLLSLGISIGFILMMALDLSIL